MADFVHLHLHTLYSLLDGAIRIKDLLKTVQAKGMKSVAVTDHGNLFGAVDFYKKAKDAGVKPILGMEAYVANDRFDLVTKLPRDFNGRKAKFLMALELPLEVEMACRSFSGSRP